MSCLSKEITFAKFNRYPSRYIYQIHCSNGNKIIHTFLTKENAYLKMENIVKALRFNNCVEKIELNDLDVRPDRIETEAGCIYELLTVKIEF